MPNPGKYKSVGVSIDAYDKLVAIADYEDRAIGRQLSRMIEETYETVQHRVKPSRPASSASGIGGLATVIED
jgi:hypothetical protein